MTAQFQLLQDSFAPFNFNLKLAETQWVVNATLASVNKGDDIENVVKQALRKGTYADLNLFYVAYLTVGPGNEGTGWATWPWGLGNWTPNGTAQPTEFDKSVDGCLVNSATVPNGTNDWGYNQGKIAVHEAGHWFGLFHVFEGGCSGPGDYVNDTFPQGGYTYTVQGVCEDDRPGCFLGTNPPNYKNHSKQSHISLLAPEDFPIGPWNYITAGNVLGCNSRLFKLNTALSNVCEPLLTLVICFLVDYSDE